MEHIRDRISKKQSDVGGKLSPDTIQISSLFWNPHIHGNGNSYKEGFTTRFMEFLAGCLKEHEASIWNCLKGMFGGTGEGVAFESVGHKKLISSQFTAFKLPGPWKGPRSVRVNFVDYPRVLVRSIEDIASLEMNKYGLPLYGNFPRVDAIVQPNYMIQFTVGATHGRAGDEATHNAIREQLIEKNKLKHVLIFIIKPEFMDAKNMFKVVGVPADLCCYYMTYLSLLDKKRGFSKIDI